VHLGLPRKAFNSFAKHARVTRREILLVKLCYFGVDFYVAKKSIRFLFEHGLVKNMDEFGYIIVQCHHLMMQRKLILMNFRVYLEELH
jgi:hypothetical protein